MMKKIISIFILIFLNYNLVFSINSLKMLSGDNIFKTLKGEKGELNKKNMESYIIGYMEGEMSSTSIVAGMYFKRFFKFDERKISLNHYVWYTMGCFDRYVYEKGNIRFVFFEFLKENPHLQKKQFFSIWNQLKRNSNYSKKENCKVWINLWKKVSNNF